MPIYDLECQNPDCTLVSPIERQTGVSEIVYCPECGLEMKRIPSVFGNYKIKGDNSASVTPKRFRGDAQ